MSVSPYYGIEPGALQTAHLTGVTLLWFAGVSEQPDPAWFDPRWLARHGHLSGGAPGRGTAHFLELGGRHLVLRQYRRGGWVRKVSRDVYCWPGLHRTRPWRELVLQAELFRQGLPVALPFAARLQRVAGLGYRADLLMVRVLGATTLAARLSGALPPDDHLREVGSVIWRFHAAGLDHADLNAHNILLDDAGTVHLIDFDRGRLRPPGRWAKRNLARLRRSLDKLARQQHDFRFSERSWELIREGYDRT